MKTLVSIPFLAIIALSFKLEPCSYSIPFENKSHFISTMVYKDKVQMPSNRDVSAIRNNLKNFKLTPKYAIYNATHLFLVPLIYASQNKQSGLMGDFDAFFSTSAVNNALTNPGESDLDKMQFSYLVAEYLRLRCGDNVLTARNDSLYKIIRAYDIDFWVNKKGNNWDGEGCLFKGKRSRMAYILTNNQYPVGREYYGIVADVDLYTMAIGASLAGYEMQKTGHVSNDMAEIVYYFITVLKHKVVFSSGNKWLLQPGVWANEESFIYAGNNNNITPLQIKKVPNISWDASHFSRMPGYLNTLSSIFNPKSDNGLFIARLKDGLGKQFAEKVMVKTGTGYKFNNFMDGNNGIYRYKYPSLPNGYAPYGNSAHVFFGWWSLLGNRDIQQMYRDISSDYDLYKIANSSKSSAELNQYQKNVIDICW